MEKAARPGWQRSRAGAFKPTGRATLIGEATMGVGHFGSLPAVGERFTAFVPIGRTYDPETGRGWEGTGIAPDIAVPQDRALEKALEMSGTTTSG